MKPPVDTVRISQQGRDQLIKLKRQTGIENWNILCRWALAASLREKSIPPQIPPQADGGVEIAWKVFAGDWSDALTAAIRVRANRDLEKTTPDAMASYFRSHLTRGLSYLASERESTGIDAFLSRWMRVNSI